MSQTAAVVVLDKMPSDEDIEDIVCAQMDEIDEDEIEASIDIIYEAPDWMALGEQDQINAHLRDGGVCVLVIYFTIGEAAYDEDDD